MVHGINDRLRDGAGIERARAMFRDRFQRRRVSRRFEDIALLERRAVGVEEGALDVGHLRRGRVGRDRVGEFGTDGKAIARQLDRGLKQFRPGEAAVFLVRHLEHGDDAGHADGKPAGDHLAFGTHLTAGVEEHVGRGRRGRRLAAVERRDLVRRGIVEHQERAAAEAGGFRFDQSQHHLRGDGGVHRRTAGTQHVEARLRRIRIGGGHHVMLGDDVGIRLGHKSEHGECGRKEFSQFHLSNPSIDPCANERRVEIRYQLGRPRKCVFSA